MRRGIIRTYTKKFLALVMAGSMILSSPIASMAKEESTKNETVYVNADANGNPTDITVSEELKSTEGGATIEDYSRLTDIENVKGDESYTIDKDGNIIWENLGQDISYQGKSTEDLPVNVKVTYYLDGKEVTPEEIAGKSGKVKIRYDYENNETDTVKVDDEEITVNTPFTVITTMILPGENFSNVEVENGKVVSDGSKSIVIGLGFPGLEDSLGLQDYEKTEDVEIPSYVEITADATNFETSISASVVTSGLLSDIDLKDLDDADDLKDDIEELTDGSKKLVDGANELADGLDTLHGSMKEYSNGVSTLDDGVKTLKDGLSTLNTKKNDIFNGANTVQDGLVALKNGGFTLSEGVNTYTAGVATVETGIKDAKDGVKQLKSGAESLSDGIEAYTAGVDTLKGGLDQLQAGLAQAMDTDVQGMIEEANTAADKLSADAGTLGKMMEDMKDVLASLSQISDKLKTAKDALNNAASGLDQVDSALKGVKSGLDSIDVGAIEDKADSNATSQAREDAKEELGDVRSALKSALDDTELDDETKNKIVDKAMGAFDTDHISVNNVLEGTGLSDSIHGAADSLGSAEGSLSEISSGIKSIVDQINVPDMPDTSSLQELLSDMKAQADILNKFGGNVSQITVSLGTLGTAVAQLDEGAATLSENSAALKLGSSALVKGASSLDGGMDKLSKGIGQITANNKTLTNGASTLANGAVQLVNGNGKLVEGLKAFNEGIDLAFSGSGDLKAGTKKLVDASEKLTDGTGKLNDGGKELKDGMEKFDTEGIEKISELAGDDLQQVIKKLKAVKKADKHYQSYGGISSGKKGNVKFIIENEPIENKD